MNPTAASSGPLQASACRAASLKPLAKAILKALHESKGKTVTVDAREYDWKVRNDCYNQAVHWMQETEDEYAKQCLHNWKNKTLKLKV